MVRGQMVRGQKGKGRMGFGPSDKRPKWCMDKRIRYLVGKVTKDQIAEDKLVKDKMVEDKVAIYR